ncbi:Zn-ribbon domain-containing OB-fold protein [Nocardia sp. NPDC003963]
MYPFDPDTTGNSGEARTRPPDDILMIHRCARCGKLFSPLTIDCSSCASDSLEEVPSSGAGSVLSWRVVDRSVIGGRGETMPLTVAVVELDEGPWVYTSIEGTIPLLPDGPVRVHYVPRPRDDRFPVFAVTDTGAPGSGIGDRPEGDRARI